MKYTLTQKGHIECPIDCRKGSFKKQDNYCYSFEVLCSDNTGTANVHVFNTDYIPAGYYDSIQAVPLSLFMREVKQRGNKVVQ